VFLTRFYSYLENYIISVERIKQFMHLPAEPPAVISDSRPPSSWPSEGRIDLQNLRVRDSKTPQNNKIIGFTPLKTLSVYRSSTGQMRLRSCEVSLAHLKQGTR